MGTLQYDPVTGFLTKNGRRMGWQHSTGYRYVNFQGKEHKEHRVIWFLVKGVWPIEVDHKNRIRNDNRWENLRDVDGSTNQRNTGLRSDNSTGYKGVSFHKGKQLFVAKIRIGPGKRKNLGCFTTAEAAFAAYAAVQSTL